MATSIKTADDLVSLFAERATRCETFYTPEQMACMPFHAQARLTVKQVNWLVDVLRRDGVYVPTKGRNAGTHGVLRDGRAYDLNIMRNGSGLLNLRDARHG